MSDVIRVMMLGTDLKSRGGISSVLNAYKDSGLLEALNIKYYGTHRDGLKINKIIYYLKALPSIFLEMHKFGIVHIHTASQWSYRRLFPILVFARILKRKIVIQLHGGQFGQYFKKAFFFERAIVKYGFSIADRIIILTSMAFKDISDLCNFNKIIIIPNGLPLSIYGNLNSERTVWPRKIILYMGNISHEKGVYDLLKAFRIVINNNSNLRLILCGTGEIKKVKLFVKKLNLTNFVYMPGWIEGSAKSEILNLTHIMVLPSYFEILPMSIIEALARGIPVVSTNIGGIPDAVENGKEGLLVEPGDVNALAEAIQLLFNDLNLWNKMQISARKKFENCFSVKIVFDRLNALYSSLMSKS